MNPNLSNLIQIKNDEFKFVSGRPQHEAVPTGGPISNASGTLQISVKLLLRRISSERCQRRRKKIDFGKNKYVTFRWMSLDLTY